MKAMTRVQKENLELLTTHIGLLNEVYNPLTVVMDDRTYKVTIIDPGKGNRGSIVKECRFDPLDRKVASEPEPTDTFDDDSNVERDRASVDDDRRKVPAREKLVIEIHDNSNSDNDTTSIGVEAEAETKVYINMESDWHILYLKSN